MIIVIAKASELPDLSLYADFLQGFYCVDLRSP